MHLSGNTASPQKDTEEKRLHTHMMPFTISSPPAPALFVGLKGDTDGKRECNASTKWRARAASPLVELNDSYFFLERYQSWRQPYKEARKGPCAKRIVSANGKRTHWHQAAASLG
jgi:hypothetical protein